jgi:hypothetical protein
MEATGVIVVAEREEIQPGAKASWFEARKQRVKER